tara:strand:+ start:362 stop:904 length:543 start_codon:yes stop_codon:yes gene_type:complete
MKVSKIQLSYIIKEELVNYLIEVGLCHSKDTGFFTDCNKSSVYSLTNKGASDNNIDKSYVGRGMVTSKEKRTPPKLRSKFGVNTSPTKQAGRKKISGDDINPVYSVSDYPDKYNEELERFKDSDLSFGIDDVVKAITFLEEGSDDECAECAHCKPRWQASFLRALNKTELASQGKLKVAK